MPVDIVTSIACGAVWKSCDKWGRGHRHRVVRRHSRETLSRSALIDELRVQSPRRSTGRDQGAPNPTTATLDYQDIVPSPVFRSSMFVPRPSTPFSDCTRLPESRQACSWKSRSRWSCGKRRLISLAKRSGVKLRSAAIPGASARGFPSPERRSPTARWAKSCLRSAASLAHLGKKIASRVKLSPVVMQPDLDFVFWLLEPAKPVRVYSQGSYGYMQPVNGSFDCMWSTVTMDNACSS